MPAATLTLGDIAAIAGVQRPVVSMWRKRASVRGQRINFPAPVARDRGVELFDRAEVEDYLRTTGRGNNPQASLDAAAYIVPDTSYDDLVTLLALREAYGDDLAHVDLAEAARAVDPDDRWCRREVAALGDPPTSYVDGLRAASLGGPDALERLTSSRAGRNERRAGLSTGGVALLAEMVHGLLTAQDVDTAQLIDGSDGHAGLGLVLAAALKVPVVIEADDGPARAVRRRAVLLGLDAGPPSGQPGVRVDSVLGLDTVDALDRLDDLQLELAPGDVGVAIGPASVLCDRFAARDDELARDEVIRKGGRLRCALRLPRGLWTTAPRQALGLWVFAEGRSGQERVAVADLSDLALSDIDAADLTVDAVAAALGDSRRSYRYALSREMSVVLAADHVVTRGARVFARTQDRETDPVVEADRLSAAIGRSAPVIGLAVAAGPGGGRRTISVAELGSRGELRILTGTRLDPGWATAAGTVEVADLTGAWSGVRFDPVELEERSPRSRRTEPGDVVFTASPPRAFVDQTGGRVVASPARVLRLSDGARVGPQALAAQVNRLPQTARDPEAWRVSLTDDPGLEPALTVLDAVRRDLRERLAAVDDLTDHLVSGVAAGELTLTQEKD